MKEFFQNQMVRVVNPKSTFYDDMGMVIDPNNGRQLSITVRFVNLDEMYFAPDELEHVRMPRQTRRRGA